jgi:oligopeptide/dipeptide ABC transporter ATP-binding protein
MHCAMSSTHVNAEAPKGEVLRLRGFGVDFHTPAGTVRAATAIDLSVARGECLGVVGESGAGKSQVFLAVMGLLAANGTARGSARFAGEELLSLSGAQLDRVRGPGIGMVFQDPMTSLTPHLRIGEQIAEVRVHHLRDSWRAARAHALRLLRQVQVTDPERRLQQYPHELSGGMRQRVMIAIALATEPQLLIADEPTTALDVTIQAQILALLLHLKRTRALAMILITHDMGAVAGVADRVAVMRAGSIIEQGAVAQILGAPREPYTQTLLRQAARLTQTGAHAAAARAPTAARLTLSDVGVDFPLTRGLLRRPARLRAVQAVSFQLHAGDSLAIVGESGCGKSTLARAVLELVRPSHGRVIWMGQGLDELARAQLRALRRQLQIVFQDPLASLDPRLTAREIVAEGLEVHARALTAHERAAAVLKMFRRVGLPEELAARYPHELSGGQCQRVGIARAMILEPELLVCDEPVSALDVPTQEQIVILLAQLKRETGLCLIFISHNLALVRVLCERVLVMYLGRMMELAPADALFAHPRHPYTHELLRAMPSTDPQVQPQRLTGVRAGEPPSPLHPPSGCVYRTRCALALPLCAERAPPWEEVSAGHWVACHRWRELPPA